MKIKQLMAFFMVWFVMLNFCSQVTFADKTYEKCIIPIISDKTEELTWNGLKKDGIIYITLEDACTLTESKVVTNSNKKFVTERNTVKVFGNLEDNAACLSVTELNTNLFSWDGKNLTSPQAGLTNKILYEQPFHLNMTYFEGKVWVDLFSYANCFGADINILTEDSESYKYLGKLNLTQFDGCYTIETGIPFDEIYTEFMNNSELQFEWIDWGQEVGVFVAKGYDAVINDYQNIFTQTYYDKFNSSDAYYDVLLKVLQCRPIYFGDENDLIDNLKKMQEEYDKQVNRGFFVADRFLKGDDPLIEKAKSHLEVSKVIYSAVTDSAKLEQKYMTLIDTVSKMNGIELSILEKSLLDERIKDEEAYNSKNPADYVSNYSQLMKKVFPALSGVYSTVESSATKFQKIFESYSSLYDSANKLSDEIQDPSKLTQEKYNEVAENIFTVAGDTFVGEAIDKFAPQAKPILDVYDMVLKEMKSDTVSSVTDAAQAHFIQETVLKNVKLDKSDASYYSMLMAMQSSYFANKNMLSIDANVSKEQAALAASDEIKKTSILSQLENLITQAYTCNRNFYNIPIGDWKTQLVEKFTGSMSGNIPDYSISTELYQQEPITNYEWHLEPTIEADNIIVPDYDGELFEKYAIIEKGGKYGLISNTGKNEVECKHSGYAICFLDNTYIMANKIDKINNYICESDDYILENNKLVKSQHGGHGGDWVNYAYDQTAKEVLGLGLGTSEKYTGKEVVPAELGINKNEDGWFEEYGKWGLVSGNGIVKDFIYTNGRYTDNLVALEENNLWGYFDRNGKEIIPFIAERSSYINSEEWISSTSPYDNMAFMDVDGILAVNTKDGGCFYDIKGNQLTNPDEFEEVRPMINGFAWVKKDGKWGVIRLKAFEKNDDHKNENWQQLYAEELKRYMTSDEYNSDVMFDLYDINNDSIPELFISTGEYRIAYCFAYTVFNGKLIKSNRKYGEYGSIACSQSKQTICSYTMLEGYETISYHQLVDDTFITMIIGSNDSGAVVEEKATYQINDEIVTAEKYNEELSKYEADDYVEAGRKYKLDKATINSVLLNIKTAKEPLFTGTVNTEKDPLNVRKSPSTEAKIIGRIDKGSTVTVYSESDGWCEIEYNGGIGYVSSDYISKNLKKEKITMEDFRKGVNCFISKNWKSNIYYKIPQSFCYEENDCFYGEIRTEDNNSPVAGWCEVNKNTGVGKISMLDGTETTFNINDYL